MAIIMIKYYDSGNFEAEILMKCKKCKAITPHKWIRESWLEEEGNVLCEVTHDTYICENCKHKEEEYRVTPI